VHLKLAEKADLRPLLVIYSGWPDFAISRPGMQFSQCAPMHSMGSMKTIRYNVSRGPARGRGLLLLGILVIGATLRAPITIVGPLLDLIRQNFGLSAGQAGMLTALPLVAFAVMSPLISILGNRFGLERTLFAGMAIVAAGIALRSNGQVWALFAGTWLIGTGIATGNVLLPSLLKRDFATAAAKLTASYTLAMALASALTSAGAVPLALLHANGWSIALGSVIFLPVLALLLFVPQLRGSAPAVGSAAASGRVATMTWRSALAWQISIFMGINSLLYYVSVSWLSSVLVHAGYSHQQAGTLQGVMHVASAMTALVMVSAGRHFQAQRVAAVGTSSLTGLAFAGLALVPGLAIAWTCLLGVGIGAGMILSLSFLSLRASNAAQVAALSGMAQCVGYVLGAAGPLLFGVLHEVQGGWPLPMIECSGLALIMAGAGWMAGRDMQIDTAASTLRPQRARPAVKLPSAKANRPNTR